MKGRIENLVDGGFSDSKSKGTPLSVAVFTETVGVVEGQSTGEKVLEIFVFRRVVAYVFFWTVFVRFCSLTCWSFGFLVSSLK